MIALEDCIGLCGLTEDEIDAIAEHEHLSEMAATALADYLLHRAHGAEVIRDMIRDDIREALSHQRLHHAKVLLAALRHFVAEHPDARGA